MLPRGLGPSTHRKTHVAECVDMPMQTKTLLCLVASLAMVGCASDDATPSGVLDEIQAEGLNVSILFEGLERPTQLAIADNGELLVAQLAGAENDEMGQILAIDPESGESVVLFDGLDKPTGVAQLGEEIWVMERNRLSVGPRSGGDLRVVLADLPSNGRSESSLSVLNADELLFATSGQLRQGAITEGSGTLFAINAAHEVRELANGFKNAYGHYVDSDEQIWVTEVSDGTFDDVPAVDEVTSVEIGADHGWPWCVGDNRFVEQFAQLGTSDQCDQVSEPSAVFEAGATPTSVAAIPWNPTSLAVTLWNRGLVVVVSPETPETTTGSVTMLSGVNHPQQILAYRDEMLLLDHDLGRILVLGQG